MHKNNYNKKPSKSLLNLARNSNHLRKTPGTQKQDRDDPRSPQEKDKLQQNLTQVKEELMLIKLKVEKSKPILQTMYNKIQKRQIVHAQSLQQLKNKIALNMSRTVEYKELFEESLRVLHKNKIIQRYKGPTNFIHTFTQGKFQKTIKENNIVRRKMLQESNQNQSERQQRIKSIKKYMNNQDKQNVSKQKIYQKLEEKFEKQLKRSKTKQKLQLLNAKISKDLYLFNIKRPKAIEQDSSLSDSSIKVKYLSKQKEKLKQI